VETDLGSESKRAERLRHVSSERGEVENHEGFTLELRARGRKIRHRSVPTEGRRRRVDVEKKLTCPESEV